MTKEDFEKLKSTVKQWLFHTGSLDPTNYANELKLKFIEPKEKRIEELTEWLNDASDEKLKLQMLRVDLVSKIGNQEKRITELEKENAELKEKVKPENCLKLLAKEGYIKFTNDQLTKAKEIIYEYVRLANLEKEDTIAIWQLYHKTEQFLKEADE